MGVRQPPTSCDFETAHHDLLMICQELSQKYKNLKGELGPPVNHVTLFGPKVASSGTNAPIRSTHGWRGNLLNLPKMGEIPALSSYLMVFQFFFGANFL